MTDRHRVALFIDPLGPRLSGDRLFGEHRYGDYNEPYRQVKRALEERGIPVHTGDLLIDGSVEAELNLYVTMGLRSRFPSLIRRRDTILSAFVVHECPIVAPALFADLYEASGSFRRMYSYSSDAALRPFLTGPVHFARAMYSHPADTVDQVAWSRGDRRFLAIVNANKVPPLKTNELYTERMRAVEYFAQFDEIDLYGFGWDGPAYRVGARMPSHLVRIAYRAERLWSRLWPTNELLNAARRAWRGPTANKLQTLAGYTFAVCFENQVLEGWITEKMFDCICAGTIPVYLGAPDIEEWVPNECFIDMRHFADYRELRSFLHGLSPTDIEAYREAGREFVGSEAFYPFSKYAFADLFARIVAEDAGVAI